ncbi:MAG TPA: VOC family protein [Acidimicrobiales bacterium]|nr:VOC family protein [Acidimicrobiales bacterium]
MSRAGPRRPGTVAWVDLSTSDVEGAERFYGRLLGWRYEVHETGMGRYVVGRVDAGDVGGLMAQSPQQVAAGVPPGWTVLIASDRLKPALADAVRLGGRVLQPAMPIPGGGQVAVIADPAGAALALIQSPTADEGMVWGGEGGVAWAECLSRDAERSLRFYEELFDWKGEEGSGGYVVLTLDGERVGGLLPMPASVPPDAPSMWMVYFGVADVHGAEARAIGAGGTVLQPAHAIDEGHLAVLADPAGAVFAVFQGSGP